MSSLININSLITLYFRGKKISRKVNLKYFREKIFSRIYCSRENIFSRKYPLAKISSREHIFPQKYLLPILFLFGLLFRNIYLGLPKSSSTVDSVTTGKAHCRWQIAQFYLARRPTSSGVCVYGVRPSCASMLGTTVRHILQSSLLSFLVSYRQQAWLDLEFASYR